ncbi:MAG: SRPBCC domain-containing protein [Myxococcales bacterium]|nr:SRPBCC domain-containing protein [Myxococcales bacterium]
MGEITACYSMRFERESKHSAARLWRAITDPAEIAAWWGTPSARVDLRIGGEYFVEFAEPNPNDLTGVVTHLEPERSLVYLWDRTPVEWEIHERARGCAYVFTHHGQPPGMVEHEGGIAAGYHVGFEAIERHMDGTAIDPGHDAWTRWTEVYTPRIRELLASALAD